MKWLCSTYLILLCHIGTVDSFTPSFHQGKVPHISLHPITRSTHRLYSTTIKKSEEVQEIKKSVNGVDVLSNAFNVAPKTILGKAVPYEELTIGVLKETYPGENRVSQTPDSIRTLIKAGMSVVVQSGGKFLVFGYDCGSVLFKFLTRILVIIS